LSGRTDGGPAGGWRGRLLLPALAASPGLLLVLPAAARLLGRGGLASAGGIVVSFLAVWIVLSPIVIWLVRAVGPTRPGWLASVLAGSFTAANLSGFMHGLVLFCSLRLDLGLLFGGTIYTDRRNQDVNAPTDRLWRVIEAIGGEHGADHRRYRQRAVFLPRGLAGHAYWAAVWPFHAVIFGGMARNIARAAERTVEHASGPQGIRRR
jgi:hypothetical protein